MYFLPVENESWYTNAAGKKKKKNNQVLFD